MLVMPQVHRFHPNTRRQHGFPVKTSLNVAYEENYRRSSRPSFSEYLSNTLFRLTDEFIE